MKNLSASVLILNNFARQIALRIEILRTTQIIPEAANEMNYTYFMTFAHAIILDTCSYIDEYEDFFGVKTEPEYKDRILMIKKITKPYIKKIKEWKDIKRFRNELVAHNLRRDGEFVFWTDISHYNAPRHSADFYLLNNCLQLSQNYIYQEFKDEAEKGRADLITDLAKLPLSTMEQVNEITTQLYSKTEETAKEYNKQYPAPPFINMQN